MHWQPLSTPNRSEGKALISWDANHRSWNCCPGRADIRMDPCLLVESSGEMGRGPAGEETHPECAPRPLIQPCCLAMTNIYLLLKLLGIFFFFSHENNKIYQLKWFTEAPGARKNKWNLNPMRIWLSQTGSLCEESRNGDRDWRDHHELSGLLPSPLCMPSEWVPFPGQSSHLSALVRAHRCLYSSWSGLRMTCTSLDQHRGCCWVGTREGKSHT